MKIKGINSLKDKLLPFILPIILIILWQLLTSTGLVSGKILPKPWQVIKATITLSVSGDLVNYIGTSARRAIIGFLIGGSIGFVLGLVNGLSHNAELLLDSTIQMVRNVPLFAILSLVILWFGIGEEPKIILISLGVFFPIYLNTYHGIRSIDKGLLEMAKVYKLKRSSLFFNVILPGALPSILVGVRYSLGIMWLTLIVAETIAADSGIGYMINNARDFMQMDVIVLGVIIYALLGKLSDTIARILEKSLLKWNPNYIKD